MNKKLNGKVAIVTGASKGIGASIAKHLAAAGAQVVVNYAKSKEGADQVVAEITSNGGEAIAIQGDMSNSNDIKRLFSETKKAYGKLDILINNAGVYEFVPLEKITIEHFNEIFNLNVLGIILTSQEAAKHFGISGGTIINIGSAVSILTPPEAVVYSASKCAVNGITKCLSKELGPRNIRVNSVNPGLVQTEGTQEGGFTREDLRKDFETKASLHRIGQPDDISPMVVFLASEDASWITGDTIFVSGGIT